MHTHVPLNPEEQALMEALSPEQRLLVSQWLALEKQLRIEEGYNVQVKETLEHMIQRLQRRVPQSHLLHHQS